MKIVTTRCSSRGDRASLFTGAGEVAGSHRLEMNFDAKRKELGVEDSLKEVPGVTTRMLVAFGEHGIKSIEDLADCATDDLDGWSEAGREDGQARGYPRSLEGVARGLRDTYHKRSHQSWLDKVMSAFGTKRTSRHAQPMSAFGGKADIDWMYSDVQSGHPRL